MVRAAYMAKRTQPDIFMQVVYLATRVTRCTRDDILKLSRLMQRVNATRERGIVLRIEDEGVCVKVYVDTVYGDGKSHTGIAAM